MKGSSSEKNKLLLRLNGINEQLLLLEAEMDTAFSGLSMELIGKRFEQLENMEVRVQRLEQDIKPPAPTKRSVPAVLNTKLELAITGR
jgi:hypothetical protein